MGGARGRPASKRKPTCREHHGQEGRVERPHMRRLGSKHVVQQEVCHIEQAEDSLPAHVHGHQLATHHISKVLDHA